MHALSFLGVTAIFLIKTGTNTAVQIVQTANTTPLPTAAYEIIFSEQIMSKNEATNVATNMLIATWVQMIWDLSENFLIEPAMAKPRPAGSSKVLTNKWQLASKTSSI
jgi:hypothetical protein